MNGNKIVLDTNAVGIYLSDPEFVKTISVKKATVIISIITRLEFLSNTQLTVADKYLFEDFLNNIEMVYLTEEKDILFNTTISIRKKYKIKLPDAIIAATAIINNATLYSADEAFSNIHNLKFKLIK